MFVAIGCDIDMVCEPGSLALRGRLGKAGNGFSDRPEIGRLVIGARKGERLALRGDDENALAELRHTEFCGIDDPASNRVSQSFQRFPQLPEGTSSDSFEIGSRL